MKPWQKAGKGSQAKKKAPPDGVNAQRTRRRAGIESGPPAKKAAAVEAAAKPGAPGPTARKPRPERIIIDALKARARPMRLLETRHLLAVAMSPLIMRLCEEFEVSLNGLAQVCRQPRRTLRDAVQKKFCDSLHLFGALADGLNLSELEMMERLMACVALVVGGK